jgi:hypothetical protein
LIFATNVFATERGKKIKKKKGVDPKLDREEKTN